MMPDPREAYPRIAKLAGLGRSDELAAELAALDVPPEEAARQLRSQHLSGLVLATLGERRAGAPVAVVDALERLRPPQLVGTAELLRGLSEVRDVLAAAGIPMLLLKGLAFAERLYGAVERRPQYDLDLLVRARQRRRAASVIRRMGLRRIEHDFHSETFVRGALKVDVHGWLRRAPAYRIDEDELWASAVGIRLGPLEVETLSDEFNVVLLALAAFEDLGQGAGRLKQLLDLYLLLRAIDGETDWAGFFTRRDGENVGAIVANVIGLVAALFESDGELPELEATLAQRRPPPRVSRGLALELAFAPRKRPASFDWFAAVYPGSVAHYLAWFWLTGFPANLARFDARRLGANLRTALRRDTDS